MAQDDRAASRERLLRDPRLLELFMRASRAATRAPPPASREKSVSGAALPGEPPTGPAGRRGVLATGTGEGAEALSACHAADIVWACGLLGWAPDRARIGALVELVAGSLSTEGVDGSRLTNVVWALDRLSGRGGEGRGGRPGSESERWDRAGRVLRERASDLPFQVIPSMFEGLRVEDFRREVDFRRDDIMLGGGKVSSRRAPVHPRSRAFVRRTLTLRAHARGRRRAAGGYQ